MKIETFFPYAAGSPPAVVLGINLYAAIINAAGSQFWWLALPVAFLGVAGMIATEVYTYQMAAEALAVRAWGAFILALLGAAVCTGFVMFGVYSGANTRALISNTAIAIAAYLALAIKRYLNTIRNQKTETHDHELETLTAKRLLTNAEARKAKAQAAQSKVAEENQKVSESFGTDWRRVPEVDRKKIAKMTTKEISQTYRVSERTALNWQAYAKDKLEKE